MESPWAPHKLLIINIYAVVLHAFYQISTRNITEISYQYNPIEKSFGFLNFFLLE